MLTSSWSLERPPGAAGRAAEGECASPEGVRLGGLSPGRALLTGLWPPQKNSG